MGCSPAENSHARAAESIKPLQSLQVQNFQEEQETVNITDSALEIMEQSALLANEESKKAFRLINSLKKQFAPSDNQMELPLRFGQNCVAPSPNKNKTSVKNTRSKSDIISRASEIAENVDGVGKINPFAPPKEMAEYHLIDVGGVNRRTTLTTKPTTVSRNEPMRSPNPSKSKAAKQKSTAIQLKGTAISNQSAAIIEINGTSYIVSHGDVVAGMKVIEIQEDRIVLDKNGKEYNLTLSK